MALILQSNLVFFKVLFPVILEYFVNRRNILNDLTNCAIEHVYSEIKGNAAQDF